MDTTPLVSGDSVPVVTYARHAASGQRKARRWFTAGVAVLVLVGLVAAVSAPSVVRRWLPGKGADESTYSVKAVDLNFMLKENGELKPKNSTEIKCELEGQSTILKIVEESTQVKKGDLLVELASDAIKDRLDSEEIELRKIESGLEAAEQDLRLARNENDSKIKKCEVTLQLAELELRRYQEGDYLKALTAADLAIKQTDEDIRRKRDELQKNEELFAKNFVSKSTLDQLRFELLKAEITQEQNQLQRRILEEYEKIKNETQKQTDVEQARQELDRERQRAESREKQAQSKVDEQRSLLEMRTKRVARLREQYQKTKIYAPCDGAVQYPGEEAMWRMGGNRIAAGEKVFEGQCLLILPDTSQMIVTTRIHEADRHRVSEGLSCLITVPAVPGRSLPGRISRIAQFADTTNRWLNPELKEHATEILLDETDAPVSPGDSAEIKILIGEASNVLAVPVQCVFPRGSKNYLFVRRLGRAEAVEVKVGRSNESMVEVVDGLSPGDEVLMHVAEDLLAALPTPPAGAGMPPAGQKLAPAGRPGTPAGGGSSTAGPGTTVVVAPEAGLRAASQPTSQAASQPTGPLTSQPLSTQPSR